VFSSNNLANRALQFSIPSSGRLSPTLLGGSHFFCGERVKLAIVGSRYDPRKTPKDVIDRAEAAVREYVRTLPEGTVVVSGGAMGVDSWAVDEAIYCGLQIIKHLPDYRTYSGVVAPIMRNTLIAKECDELIAFWDGKSKGTMDTVYKARRLGKPVNVVTP
jgi:hypothetical protein